MQAISLKAEVREVTGKKVKKLRKQGLIPVGVYGKGVKSEALAIPMAEFLKIYDRVGETGLVELKYDSKSQHVLVRNVQFHPLTRLPLHVQLQAVKLTEKIKANVPLELVGDSPAVQNSVGVLLQTVNDVEVEALPAELPEKIAVDVSNLASVDDQIQVAGLDVPKGVTVLTTSEEIVVKVAPAVAEETAKELAAQEAAKAAAAAAVGETTGTAGEQATGEESSETPSEKTS